MKLYKFLAISMAVVLAGALLVGCHAGGIITTDTGSGGGEDIEIGEDSMFSSAAPSTIGRGVTLSFNVPVPEASVSAKADDVTLTRDQFEAMLVIQGPASVILRPNRFAWADDGSSVSIWGPFRYCKSYDFVLGADMVSVTIGENPLDFNLSVQCAADLPFMQSSMSADHFAAVFVDSQMLDLGDVNASSFEDDDSLWKYVDDELQHKAGMRKLGNMGAGERIAYSAITQDSMPDPRYYIWSDYSGGTDPDASIVMPTGSANYEYEPRGMGDVDGDGIDDIGIIGKEKVGDSDLAYLHIVSGAKGIGLDADLNVITDYRLNVGDSGVPFFSAGILTPFPPMGDLDGDGFDDIASAEMLKAGDIVASSEIAVYSGAEVSGGGEVEAALSIIDDDPLGYFVSVVAGDVNCDGARDLIVTGVRQVYDDISGDYEDRHQKLFVFFGPQSFPDYIPASSADVQLTVLTDFEGRLKAKVVGDLNADGCEDILLEARTSVGPKAVALIEGRTLWPAEGAMEPLAATAFGPGAGFENIAIAKGAYMGDLDNDGHDDFALECRNSFGEKIYNIYRGDRLTESMTCESANTRINKNK